MRLLPALLLPLLVSCDAWRLERAARAQCEEGLAVVLMVVDMDRGSLSASDRARTFAELSAGFHLLRDGMASYAGAEEKTGKSYEVRRNVEGLKVARMLLVELKD